MAGKSKAKYVPRCSCLEPLVTPGIVPEPLCHRCKLTVKRTPTVLPPGQHLQAQAPHANGTARPAELDATPARVGQMLARTTRRQAIDDLRAAIASSTTSEGAKRSLQFSLDRYEGLEAAETTPPPIPAPVARRGPSDGPPAPFTRADALRALRAPEQGDTP